MMHASGYTAVDAGTPVTDHPQTITLHEPCGHDWTDELLSFPVSWAPGVQWSHHLVLGTAAGPLCTQVSDLVQHADGSLASALLCCRLSLAAEETLLLEVTARGDSGCLAPLPYWRESDEIDDRSGQ